MPSERHDPDALLCKSCGYPLDDVLNEPACPECGTPVSASLPERRTGSPWQRSPSFLTWWSTLLGLLRWRDLFDSIRVGRHDGDWLLRINLGLASLLLAAAFAEDRIDQVFLHARGSLAGLLGALLILTPGAYAFLRGLTSIERAGLRYFGNKRGGRITPAIARTVTAHASYGWVLAGLLAVVGAFIGHAWLRPWYRGLDLPWLFVRPDAHIAFGLVGFFAGLIVFETLSYVGAMRCRFANPARDRDELANETHENAEPTVDDHAERAERPDQRSADQHALDVPPQADQADPARE